MNTPPEIPDHELLRKIGEGAYGDVWIARNIMGTYRAVKVVYRSRFKDEVPFEREYAGIQKFEPVSRSHPSQLNILHMGRAEGCFYYVMELGDCEHRGAQPDHEDYKPKTLYSVIKSKGPVTAKWITDTVSSLATALGHLHSAGLIHRDVKPANVVFVNGIPKLADIGLVTDIGGEKSYVGTEGYLPSEGPGKPSGDIYGLGKVLYELLTGSDPRDFPSLPDSVYEHPEKEIFFELNQVVLKACSNYAQDRYQSTEAMLKDLLVIRSGQSLLRVDSLKRLLSFNNRFGVFNMIRLVGATLLLLIMMFSSTSPWAIHSLGLYCAYWLYAVAAVVFSLSSKHARVVNSFSMPFVDMPMFYVMQSSLMWSAGTYLDGVNLGMQRGSTVGYSLAVFILMIMMTALSIRSAQILLSFVVASVLMTLLCLHGGLQWISALEAVLVMALVTCLCVFARTQSRMSGDD